MSTRRDFGAEAEGSEYSYRRSLKTRELLPAVGAGVAVGLAAFYLTKLFLEKTPLRVSRERDATQRPARAASGR